MKYIMQVKEFIDNKDAIANTNEFLAKFDPMNILSVTRIPPTLIEVASDGSDYAYGKIFIVYQELVSE